jgi:hypothetical protein
MPEHRAFVGHTPSNAEAFTLRQSLTTLLLVVPTM